MQSLTKNRVVVTGGAGFIGTHTVKELIKEGYPVVVIDNFSHPIKKEAPHGADFFEMNVQNELDLEGVIKEDDVILHLASQKNNENPLLSYEDTVRGTYSVFEVARKNKAAGVIFASSSHIYGNRTGRLLEMLTPEPFSLHGVQKAIGEQIAKSYADHFNIPTIVLRYFNVYDTEITSEQEHVSAVTRLLQQKNKGEPLTLYGNGFNVRDFIHVSDVARANISAIQLLLQKATFNCFNICTGRSTSIRELADIIGGPVIHEERQSTVRISLGDPQKATNILGFTSTINITDSIRDALATKQ